MVTQEIFTKQILPVTLKFEGGYANVKGDKGGETYCGISRNANPNWPGWAVLERYKPLTRGDLINDSELRAHVASLYWDKYFEANQFHRFLYALPALMCFDFAVHGGYSAIRLQRMLAARFSQQLLIDGVMGDKTLQAVNAQDPVRLSLAILDWRREHLRNLIQANPDYEKFAEGWNSRLTALRRVVDGNL